MTRVRYLGVGRTRMIVESTGGPEDGTTFVWDVERRSVSAALAGGSGVRRTGVVEAGGPLVVFTRPHQDGGFGVVEVADSAGRVVWARPELPIMEAYVVEAGVGVWVAVSTAHGTVALLDATTGGTVRELRGAERVWPADEGHVLCSRRGSLQLRPAVKRAIVWTADEAPILAAAASPSACICSVGTRVVSMSRADGDVLWQWEFPNFARVALSFAWCASAGGWMCVVRDRGSGSMSLLELSVKGDVKKETALGKSLEAQLFGDGRHVVLAEGLVISTATGRVVWELP